MNILSRFFSEDVVTNTEGGKQTKVKTAFHLIPSIALFAVAEVLYEGSLKYETDNWKKISIEIHLGRCLQHIHAYLAGDTTENHLPHALCRLLFAAAMKLESDNLKRDYL